MSAGRAWTWTDFNEPIGGTHNRFIVFDDDDGVALFDEASEDADHAREVARVHADAGFIEDKDRICEAGAQTGG